MKAADIPVKFPIPFGNAAGVGFIRNVPTASQIGIQDGAASLETGFPPVNFSPRAAGGTPPFGQDTNGILFRSTGWDRWFSAGGPVKWDSAFSAAVGGYPKGAVVASAVTDKLLWISTADDNLTDPDAAGLGWQSFGVGASGVTAATYLRPQITIDSAGRATAAANGTYPTRQTLLSGTSLTYTTPAGVKRLSIRMIGGGASGGPAAGNGGNTSFNSIVAAGAVAATGGTGGAGSASVRLAGGNGGAGGLSSTGTVGQIGGNGGNGAFGGGAGSGNGAGKTNTGGGGAGLSPAAGNNAPSGGGAGEYAELSINNPTATYTYTVGAGGTGSGGAGGSGIIIVDEFYD